MNDVWVLLYADRTRGRTSDLFLSAEKGLRYSNCANITVELDGVDADDVHLFL